MINCQSKDIDLLMDGIDSIVLRELRECIIFFIYFEENKY